MYPNYSAPQQKSAFNTYAVPALIVIHIIAFSFCVTADDFPTKTFAHVLLGMIFSTVASSATMLYSKSNVPKVIAVFLVATCAVKVPICLIAPETTFLEVLPLEGKLLAEVVCSKFFWFSLGFLGYSAGAIFASRFFWNMSDPAKRDLQMSAPEKGFVLVLVLYGALQGMRGFLLLVLQIGAPNVAGRELLIPKLAGVLTILGTRGLLLVTVGLLAVSLSRRSTSGLLISMLAALAYAGVEMAGGWRSGLYYYALCGSWVYLAAQPSKLKNRLKPFAVGFVVLAFVLFIPVMDYRHNLNRGMSHGEAFKAVLEVRQDDERNVAEKLHKIIRRFNGIDLYMTASVGSEERKLGIISLFNGQASKFFTYGILGIPEEAVTTQGITFWGSIAIALGDQWLAATGFLLGAVIGGLPVFCRRWFYTPTMCSVYECTATITLLATVMGNGGFLLYGKELMLGFLVCYLFRLIVSNHESAMYYPQGQVPYSHQQFPQYPQ